MQADSHVPILVYGIAVAQGIATVALLILAGLYLRRHQPKVYEQDRHLLLIALVIVIAAVLLKASTILLGVALSPHQQGIATMLVVCMAGMVLAILLGQWLATWVSLGLSVYASFLSPPWIPYVYILPAFLSAVVGIYFTSDMSDRGRLIHAALWLAFVNILAVGVIDVAFHRASYDLLIPGIAWGGVGSFMAIGVVWVTIALLEKPFGIATHVTLIELSNPMGKLLQQVQNDAPGTFMHSMHVANLAERAAESIGADALLARVGSQYHDIGKIKRPRFFIENLVYYGENQHDKMTPMLSALVVRAHVRDGMEMAKQHRLPASVSSFIAQHHGTTLVTFFYYRAISESGCVPDAPLESQFRYEGPLPQSRETAIVMLADTIEAATRCEREPTKERLTDTVERLVGEKSAAGQLAESGLTPLDLEQVKASLVRSLVGMLHARVEYPELPDVSGAGAEESAESTVIRKEPSHDGDGDLAQAGADAGVSDTGTDVKDTVGGGGATPGGSNGAGNGRSGDAASQRPIPREEPADERAGVFE